jgi:hypothetical protein
LVDCSAWEQQQQLLLVVDSGLKVLCSAFCLHASSSAQQIAGYWLYITVAQILSFEGGSRWTVQQVTLPIVVLQQQLVGMQCCCAQVGSEC